jgi:hypothetical protein
MLARDISIRNAQLRCRATKRLKARARRSVTIRSLAVCTVRGGATGLRYIRIGRCGIAFTNAINRANAPARQQAAVQVHQPLRQRFP